MPSSNNGDRWTTQYPELGTGPVPVEPCISREYFELERERIFRRAWLNVGRVEDIPNVGDYFVKDIPLCNTSVLVTRGRDGVIRSFHNVCSHRLNKLVWDERGCRRGFTCEFHGWTYNAEGKLTGVPDLDQFFDFRKEDHGLCAVSTDTWAGFIFINLDPRPKETLKEFLGEMGEGLAEFPFGQMELFASYRENIGSNWKVAMDAFVEAYHAVFLHRRSIPDFVPKDNPLGHALAFKLYKYHRMISVAGNPKSVFSNPMSVYLEPDEAAEAKLSPMDRLAQRYGRATARPDFHPDRMPAAVNPTKSPAWAFDINVIFPNFWLAVRGTHVHTYNFWPLAPDRTLWEARMYYPKAETARERFYQEYRKITGRDAWREDLSTLEKTQQVLASGVKTHMLLSDQELLVRHAYKVIEDFVKPERARAGAKEGTGV